MTVSPSYQQRGVPNPFYTISTIEDGKVKRLTKIKEPTYKNIKEKGSLKLLGNPSGKFMFKIYSGIKEKPSVLNPSAYSLQAIFFLD